ncbi:Uncharacterized protein Fot_37402 [Forsythia ovata]|uniref:Uncharacterized protein n=1 Tax=Forsythia ovata TaxID=205694 RepID=A0ABD1RYX2_9LAMI
MNLELLDMVDDGLAIQSKLQGLKIYIDELYSSYVHSIWIACSFPQGIYFVLHGEDYLILAYNMNAASLTVCRYGKREGTTQLNGFATLQKLVHMRSDARINGVAAVEGRIISVHFSSKLEVASVPYPVSFEIPVILNAIGGILVGLVTTYAGGVRKISLNLD